ncbi:hypothetical protein HK104_010756 [Borealophlyctis nickersoniae]|nr:hypothetical protein HK104_010756 [Borealophlyctis nickersoniae]
MPDDAIILDEYKSKILRETLELCMTTLPALMEATAALVTGGTDKRAFLQGQIRSLCEKVITACECCDPLVTSNDKRTLLWRQSIDKTRKAVDSLVQRLPQSTNSINRWASAADETNPAVSITTYLTLPSDVLWHIAWSVREHSNLQALCLVSRSWHAAAAPRLWSYIGLRSGKYSQVCFALFKLNLVLRGNPAIGAFIKEIEIRVGWEDEGEDDVDEYYREADFELDLTMGRLMHDVLLVRTLLALIPNVETLHIHIEPMQMYGGFAGGSLPSLRHLDLSSSPVSELNVVPVVACCPNLEELFLRDCTEITRTGFVSIVSHIPHLRAIGINGCELLNDDSIHRLVEACPKLESIALGYRQTLTDASIIHLTSGAPLLQALFLDGRDTIREDTLFDLIDKVGENLISLSLSYCVVTDRLVHAIADRCPKLQNFGLSGCKREVTDGSIRRLMDRCRRLRVLALDENDGISEELDEEIVERYGEDVPSITREFKYYRKWL